MSHKKPRQHNQPKQKKIRKFREKKTRGSRAKEFYTVKISNITPEGFNLHSNNKDYYVKRTKYPWFLDATNEELHDSWRILGLEDEHGDMIFWGKLGVELELEIFDNPDFEVYSVFVRNIHRPDLFAKSDYIKK